MNGRVKVVNVLVDVVNVLVNLSSQNFQPRPAIFICQRFSNRHFPDIVRGMKIIGIQKRATQLSG